MLDSLLYPLDKLISLQLRVAMAIYGRYQVPMLDSWLDALFNVHRYLLSNPWFVRLSWWCCVARSWWLMLDHHTTFYAGTNVLWLYTLPFTLVKELVMSGIRIARQVVERTLNAYGRTLATSTSICAKLGVLGDLLLVPITLIWMR